MKNSKTNKSLLKALLGLIIIISFYSRLDFTPTFFSKGDSCLTEDELHEYFLKNSPYQNTKNLGRKERKALGKPANAYNERVFELTMDPSLGYPTTEEKYKIQEELVQKRLKEKKDPYINLAVPGQDARNSWISIGPKDTGGRTRAALFDLNDAEGDRVFAGGVSGGLWVNDKIDSDQSTPWDYVSGVPGNLAVSVIVQSESNPNIMYVGTGESYTGDDAKGNGIYKSEDGGLNWVKVFGRNFQNIQSTDQQYYISVEGEFFVNDMSFWTDPSTNTEYIIAALGKGYDKTGEMWEYFDVDSSGLYVSADGGSSWDKLNMPLNRNNRKEDYNDIEIDASNRIWVSTNQNINNDPAGRFYYSSDAKNFQSINVSYPGVSNSYIRRVEFATSADDPDTFYVLMSAGSPLQAEIFKTTNSFASVVKLNEPRDTDTGIPAHDFTRYQSWYDLEIEVDPSNDNIIYVGGINLYRSTNGGTSWKQLSKWDPYFSLNGSVVHADQHGIYFSPKNPDAGVVVNDGGVYYTPSFEQSESSANFVSQEEEFITSQFYRVAQTPIDFNEDIILGGTQDNGSLMLRNQSLNTLSTSTIWAGGDGGFPYFDQVDTKYFISNYIYNDQLQYYSFSDNRTRNLNTGGQEGDFINPGGLDSNLDILYVNGSRGSSYRIRRFFDLDTTSPRNDYLNGFSASPTTFNISPYTTTSTTLLVGFENGEIMRIDNANTGNPTRTILTDKLGSVSDLEYGRNEQEIYATFYNYGVNNIYFSNDGGITWIEKDGDLPNFPVLAILPNPFNEDEVIIGTELGVWKTGDFKSDNPKWSQSYNGMSDVKVTDLQFRGDSPTNNRVVAATYGRGIFVGSFTDDCTDCDTSLPNTIVQKVQSPIGELTLNMHLENFRDENFEVLIHANGGYTSYTPGESRTYLGSVSERKDAYVVGLKSSTGEFKTVVIIDRGVTWYFSDEDLVSEQGSLDYSDVTYNWPATMTTASDYAGKTMYEFGMGYDLSANSYQTIFKNSKRDAFEGVEFSNALLAATYMQNALVKPMITRVIIRTDSTSPYFNLGGSNRLSEVTDEWVKNQSDALEYTFKVSFAMWKHPIGGVAWAPGVFNVNDLDDERRHNTLYNTTRHELGHNFWAKDYDGGYYVESKGKSLGPEGKTIMNGNAYARFAGPATQDLLMYRDQHLFSATDRHLKYGNDYSSDIGTYTSTEFPPYAALDIETLIAGSKYRIDVLANDFDANGQNLKLKSFDSTSSGGSFIERSSNTGLNGRDELLISPNLNNNLDEVDHFFYVVEDSKGNESVGVVFLRTLDSQGPWVFSHVDVDNVYLARGISKEYKPEIGYLKYDKDDSFAQWNLRVPQKGLYSLKVVYGSKYSSEKIQIEVNDNIIETLSTINTGSLEEVTESEEIQLALDKGNNELILRGLSSNIGSNFGVRNLILSPNFSIEEIQYPPYFLNDPISISNIKANEPLEISKALESHIGDLNTNDTHIYGKISGPQWLTISPDGSLTGTPSSVNVGLNIFKIYVRDSAENESQGELHIDVQEILNSNYYEAEEANFSGGAIRNSNGVSYVDFDEGPNNSFIEWTIQSSISAVAQLSIRYANGDSNRPLQLKVNDAVINSNLPLPNTTNWTNYEYTEVVGINLKSGTNTIRVSEANVKGANIDHLLVEVLRDATGEDDSDSDGVPDSDDECPNTPVGVTVNSKGCEILNTAPVAEDIYITVTEQVLESFNLSGYDADGDPLRYTLTGKPNYGEATLDMNVVEYRSISDNALMDGLTYVVSDEYETSEPASVQITIEPVNDIPTVTNINFEVERGVSSVFNLPEKDSDGDILGYEIIDEPINGSAVISGNEITYLTTSASATEDSFTYVAKDGLSQSTSALFNIIIEEQVKEERFEAELASLLSDVDVDNSNGGYSGSGYGDFKGSGEEAYIEWSIPMTQARSVKASFIYALGANSNRPLELSVNGTIIESSLDFPSSGSWSQYIATESTNFDLLEGENKIRISGTGSSGGNIDYLLLEYVVFNTENNRPITSDISGELNEDELFSFELQAEDADGEELSFLIIDFPSNGKVSLSGAELTYTPNENYFGSDELSYSASDGSLTSSKSKISLEILPINDAPQIEINDLIVAKEGVGETLINTIDPENNEIELQIVSNPVFGTIEILDKMVKYTNTDPSASQDSFTISASDQELITEKIVSVSIVADNQTPSVTDFQKTINEDEQLTTTLLASDPEGSSLQFEIISEPINGTVELDSSTGEIIYSPKENYYGPDEIEYQVSDGILRSGIGRLDITISPVNDDPITQDLDLIILEDESIDIVLVANDIETTSLTLSISLEPEHGSVALENGSALYIPNQDYFGADTFNYTASDGELTSESTVTILIEQKDDRPETNEFNINIEEDSEPITITLSASDSDSENLTYIISTQPQNGTAELTGQVNNNDECIDCFCGPELTIINQEVLDDYAQDRSKNYLVRPSNLVDRDWIGDRITATIADIEYNFSEARKKDTSVYEEYKELVFPDSFKELVCPSGSTDCAESEKIERWFTFTDQEKGLYLANAERIARGLPPFEGVAQELVDIAQAYADLIAEKGSLGHYFPLRINGVDTQNPWERIASNPKIKNNSEYYNFSENIAYQSYYRNEGSIPTEFSFYMYLYDDAASNWGHRNFFLSILNENSGDDSKEGILGFGTAVVQNGDWVTQWTVMNAFDPIDTWDFDSMLLNCAEEDFENQSSTSNELVYSPNPDYNGEDFIGYKAFDGENYSLESKVNITITPINDQPVHQNISFEVNRGVSYELELEEKDKDGDTLYYLINKEANNGNIVIDSKMVYYKATSTSATNDYFELIAFDGNIESEPFGVEVTIQDNYTSEIYEAEDALFEGARSSSSNEGYSGNGYVDYTDSGSSAFIEWKITSSKAETAEIAFVYANGGSNRPLKLVVNGETIVDLLPFYTTNSWFNYLSSEKQRIELVEGENTIRISATGKSGANIDFLEVYYPNNESVNSQPITYDVEATIEEKQTAAISLDGIDVDEDELTFKIITEPSNGSAEIEGNILSYIPDDDFYGVDTIIYSANDGVLDSEPSKISIEVFKVNERPTVSSMSKTTFEDTAVDIILSGEDLDGDKIYFNLEDEPLNGAVEIIDGTATYIPNLNYVGEDEFSFSATDGNLISEKGTITLTIEGVNDVPTTQPLLVETMQNEQVEFILLANDIDEDELFYIITKGVEYGELEPIGSSGAIYTPNTDFSGVDEFSFKVYDGELYSKENTVTINVTRINSTPIAKSFDLNIPKGINYRIPLSATDDDGDFIQFELVSEPTYGSAELDGNEVVYFNDSDTSDSDSFTYLATDGFSVSNTAEIKINLVSDNSAPIVSDIEIETQEETASIIVLEGVDPENSELSFLISKNGEYGNATIEGNELTYTPSNNFVGVDKVYFTANDGILNSEEGEITITVTNVNDSPITENLEVLINEDEEISIQLIGLDNDGDTITYEIIQEPTNGSVSIVSEQAIYTPNLNFNGNDTFVYRASDGTLFSNESTVSLTISPSQDSPVAENMNISLSEDELVTFSLDASDPDSDEIILSIIESPTHGTITVEELTVSYTPEANYFGLDSLTYKVEDPLMATDMGVVSFNINGVNDVPEALVLTQNIIDENTSGAIGILEVIDADKENYSFEIIAEESQSPESFRIDENGTLYVEEPLDFEKMESYNLNIEASSLETDDSISSVFTVLVNDLNDIGVTAVIQDAYCNESGGTGAISITLNDTTGATSLVWTFNDEVISNESSIESLSPGIYQLEVTDEKYVKEFSFEVQEIPVYEGLAICYVTSDEENPSNNRIHLSYSNIYNDATYQILRESEVANQYEVIGEVLSGETSFLDRTSNNLTTPYSYRVRMVDNCGNFSGLSKSHSTMLLQSSVSTDNTVNLSWNKYIGRDYGTYRIYRRENNGDFELIKSLSSNFNFYIDTEADTEVNSYTYYVAIELEGCETTALNETEATEKKRPLFGFATNEEVTLKSNIKVIASAANVAPVSENVTVSLDEDEQVSFDIEATDANGDDLFINLISNPENGTILLNGSTITYIPEANYSGVDSFAYQVSDGVLDSDVSVAIITVNPVNDLPEIQALPTFEIQEDESVGSVITELVTYDIDNVELTYTITGSGANDFKIENQEIVLVNTLDYEEIEEYNLEVVVNDGTDEVSTSLVISVLDIPNTSVDVEYAIEVYDVVNEDNTQKIDYRNYTSSTENTETGNIIFKISGGVDADLFTIDKHTGGLDFIEAPDYENPSDEDKNNVYEVVVTVSNIEDGSTEVPVTTNQNSFAVPEAQTAAADIDAIVTTNQTDTDSDGVVDTEDNCPTSYNPGQEDQDGDGVGDVCDDSDMDTFFDAFDECPSSKLGATVDAKGCEVFALPSNTFSVSVTSATCPDSSNGSITISSSNTDYSYRYAIDDQAAVPLTDNAQTISNLSAGVYNICITVDGVSDYQRCYTIEITEPAPLVANSRVNLSTRSMQIDLSGATEYQVTLNGKTYLTKENNLNLNLEPGMNRVEVATGIDCQGVYVEEIFVSEEVKIYPNPTPGPTQVYVAGDDQEITLLVRGFSGAIIEVLDYKVPYNRVINVDLSSLPQGIYLIEIRGKSVRDTQKIIKE